MWSGKPDPLCADIVYVREDGGDGAGVARWLGTPSGRVKMFDDDLVHTLIGGENPDGGLAELGVDGVLTLGHGCLLLDPIILPGWR